MRGDRRGVQNSSAVNLRRALNTRGSSGPTRSKYSISRSRNNFFPSVSALGDSVRSRSNPSAIWPPEISSSAARSCAEIGCAPAVRPLPYLFRGAVPAVRHPPAAQPPRYLAGSGGSPFGSSSPPPRSLLGRGRPLLPGVVADVAPPPPLPTHRRFPTRQPRADR